MAVSSKQVELDTGSVGSAGRGSGNTMLLAVLSVAAFLEGMDVSMKGVVLPELRAELGMSTAGLQWVISGYVLGYAGFLMLGGRAADLFGRRRMFLIWLLIFAVLSALGGFTADPNVLIATRFGTGIAAAFLTPAAMSLITTTIPEGPKRDQALLIYAGIGAAGFALGMMVGGLLAGLHWRWTFFGPALLAGLTFLVSLRVVPGSGRAERGGAERGRIDLLGGLALTGALLALVAALVGVAEPGPVPAWALLAVGVVLLVVFVVVESRVRQPLIQLGVLRSGPLALSAFGGFLMLSAFTAFQFVFVLYLQEERGWSAVETGFAMALLGVDAVVGPLLTPILMRRFGRHAVLVAGFAAGLLGYLLVVPIGPERGVETMLPSMLLIGVSFAFLFGPLVIMATGAVGEADQGLAGGVVNTAIQFGAAVGVAAASVGLASAGARLDADDATGVYQQALVIPVVLAALGLMSFAVYAMRHRTTAGRR